MDYLKKSLKKIDESKDYEEIDTRLASGWYVDSIGSKKQKKYKTDKVSFKISKRNWILIIFLNIQYLLLHIEIYKTMVRTKNCPNKKEMYPFILDFVKFYSILKCP